VDGLGGNTPLPVEIVSFGWKTVLDRLAVLGCAPRLRVVGKTPFTTDGDKLHRRRRRRDARSSGVGSRALCDGLCDRMKEIDHGDGSVVTAPV
jgi:Ribose 5-phosphate isomerase A (phosphoriboisomerase A)